ncbi:MAG: hypothetical protein ACYS91_02730 [Planctomycetota bacterium]|jgi:hypothetical protein
MLNLTINTRPNSLAQYAGEIEAPNACDRPPKIAFRRKGKQTIQEKRGVRNENNCDCRGTFQVGKIASRRKDEQMNQAKKWAGVQAKR